jgi:hypothetical protein
LIHPTERNEIMTNLQNTTRNILRFCSAIAVSAWFYGTAQAGHPSQGHVQAVLVIDDAGGHSSEADVVGDSAPKAEAVRYTCPMHPEVVADSPGRCPHCGMKLVEQEQGPKMAEGL